MTPVTKYHQTVAGTFFPTKNLKHKMYLGPGQFQVLFYPPKTWSVTSTGDLAGRRYLFPHSKPDARDVFVTRPVSGTCWPTQNMRRDVYIPATVFPPKIWSAACTWGLAGVSRYCFRFFACKNHNAGAAAGKPAEGAFLSNTSLAVFAFSIANAEAAAAGVSGWSHVPVSAFPLVKVVTRGRQLQVCQADRTYLFSLFRL